MFLLLAHQLFLITGICMRMTVGCRFRFLQPAGQTGFFLITISVVRVTLRFFLLTGQISVLIVAALAMRVTVGLAKTTYKNALRLIAFVRMRMTGHGFCGFRFFQITNQNTLIAFLLRVRMCLLSAIGFIGHGDGGKNQRIGCAEHYNTRQSSHNAPPMLLTQVLSNGIMYLLW